ncbi:MAG: DUF2135 domain-containing protein [Candidatus ainarchaeum sp.]|nr:DUF2135 domain-containing protein [Candidatus ainarchaeum sp.]
MKKAWVLGVFAVAAAAMLLSGCCGIDLSQFMPGTGGATVSGLTGKNTGVHTGDGGTTTDRVQTVSGTVENPAGAGATTFGGRVVVSLNGQPQYVTPVRSANGTWTYSSDMVIRRGTNTIRVSVEDESGSTVATSNPFTVTGNLPMRDIEVVLTWNTDRNDVDMHVYSPSGQHAWYQNLDGISGCNLDLDDTDGYGPETFVCETAPETGQWTVKVRYYNDKDVTSPVTATIRTTLHEGSAQSYTHAFTQDQANSDDPSNDWTATTFNMP